MRASYRLGVGELFLHSQKLPGKVREPIEGEAKIDARGVLQIPIFSFAAISKPISLTVCVGRDPAFGTPLASNFLEAAVYYCA